VEEFAFKVTGMVTVLPPGPDTLMKPTSVPEAGAPLPTEAVIVSGVAPELGVTCSHPVLEYAVTATLTGLIEDDTSTL
jgi:hypothetical protein